MNASGKRIRRAPPAAASAATSEMRSIVAARSKSTGSTWTQATLTGSRMPPIVAVSAPHAQGRAHAELCVVGDRAPEAVAARAQVHYELGAVSGARQRETERVHPADPAHAEIVDVLAVVLELDHD